MSRASRLEALLTQLATPDSAHHLELDLFGTDQPTRIAAAVDRFCREQLGAPIASYLFWASSVGSVHGVALADGRRVVVKALRPATDVARLRAQRTVQRQLAVAGFPVPVPLAGPAPLARGVAVADEWLGHGERADGHQAAVRAIVAESLARVVALGRPLGPLPILGTSLLGRPPVGELWPRPHDVRFDFPGTSRGAEWIDRAARAARAASDHGAGDWVIGHADWRVEHLRFQNARVVASYDWDSLCWEREPVLAGLAAHGFTADWSADPPPPVPSADEARAFVADYETARGTRFTGPEREAAEAALRYAAAYGARCEHSDALTGFGRHPPQGAPPPPRPGTYLGLLDDLPPAP